MALQIIACTNVAAGLAAAFIESSSKLMSKLNEKFPPTQIVDRLVITCLRQLFGIAIKVVLLLTIVGLLALESFGNLIRRLAAPPRPNHRQRRGLRGERRRSRTANRGTC